MGIGALCVPRRGKKMQSMGVIDEVEAWRSTKSKQSEEGHRGIPRLSENPHYVSLDFRLGNLRQDQNTKAFVNDYRDIGM